MKEQLAQCGENHRCCRIGSRTFEEAEQVPRGLPVHLL
jgi:hypothetical protein